METKVLTDVTREHQMIPLAKVQSLSSINFPNMRELIQPAELLVTYEILVTRNSEELNFSVFSLCSIA